VGNNVVKTIYLDVCCFNRPFDDLGQDRVRLEAEAILTILSMCETGAWKMVISDVVEFEIHAIPDFERQEKVQFMTSRAGERIKINDAIKECAKDLLRIGFKAYDALHLACAQDFSCDIFLTTDDKLIKLARKNRKVIGVRVDNPVIWLMEVMQSGLDYES